jgi:hypothetical protein
VPRGNCGMHHLLWEELAVGSRDLNTVETIAKECPCGLQYDIRLSSPST